MNDSGTRTKSSLPNAADVSERKVKPLFETGEVLIARRVLDKFPLAVIDDFLVDHVECVTGPCSDWQLVNEFALRDGGPIFTGFRDDSGNEGYIVTNPDRLKTIVMMRTDEK